MQHERISGFQIVCSVGTCSKVRFEGKLYKQTFAPTVLLKNRCAIEFSEWPVNKNTPGKRHKLVTNINYIAR